jgi:hypothetical protein
MNTSQGEYDLINSHNNLLEKITIVRHHYRDCWKDFQDLEHVNKSLVTGLFESPVLIDSLKSEKESLANDLSKSHILIDSLKSEIFVLVEKSLSLENELNGSKELSRNSSSDNMKSLLCIEEFVSNKLSMIVDNAGTSMSHASNKSLNVELVNDSISKTPSVKQTQGKLFPTCHHCGIIGHIRPNCRKFKVSPKKENQAAASTFHGKKGKKIHLEHHAFYPKPRVMHPPRKLPSKKFVLTCHHCGKIGHI